MPPLATDQTARISELRSSLLEQGDKLRELRGIAATDRGDTYQADTRDAVDTIHQLDAELSAIERAEQRSAGTVAAHEGTGDEYRTPGQMFVQHEAYTGRHDARRTDEVEVRTLLTTSTSDPATGLFLPRAQPVPPQPRQQRLFVRDLLSVQDTTMSSIPYIRELNATTNEAGASVVSEGETKPEVTMQFESADAPVRKIAAWVPVTDEIIEDAPTLQGYIDTRLVYMLALEEQRQILNGGGTAPALRGIRQTSGLQTQAFSVDIASTLGLAIGKVEAVDGDADGIAMNPTDYWTMLTTRSANQFDGGFGAGAPFAAPSLGIWGLRVVRTRALSTGVALVGSWALGATLFDRKTATVRVYDQHSDYAVKNKVVVLAEERVALAVHRPDFFVEADVSA